MLTSITTNFENFVTRTEKKLGDDAASMVYIFIAVLTHFMMMVWTKLHLADVPPVEAQFFRGIFITFLIYNFCKLKDIPVVPENRKMGNFIILRNLLAGLFNVIMFFIVSKLPISSTILIQSCSPFIVAFMDHVFRKTVYTRTEIIFSFVSLTGVAFVIRPDFFINVQLPNQAQYGYAEGVERLIWSGIFFLAVIMWCSSIVMMKFMGGVHAMTVNIPFGICLATASSVLMIQSQQARTLSIYIYLQLAFFLGIITFINQYAYVKSNQLGKPAKITMMGNLMIAYSFLFESFYLGETAHWVSLVGAVLIVGSSIILSISRL